MEDMRKLKPSTPPFLEDYDDGLFASDSVAVLCGSAGL